MMACREEGPGRLPEWEDVQEILLRALTEQDLAGERVLITAGPTREPLDPARFLSNRSSGKMGYALARTAYRRGAEVHLVSGPVALPCPPGVERVSVQTAREMHAAVFELAETASVIIKAAAVADSRPAVEEQEKVKKDRAGLSLQLSRNPDILYELGRNRKEGQILVGFAAESSNLQAEGRKKLATKNLDLIAVNNICSDTSGFECDTNQILLIDREREDLLPMTSKEQTADMIWDRVVDLRGRRRESSGGG